MFSSKMKSLAAGAVALAIAGAVSTRKEPQADLLDVGPVPEHLWKSFSFSSRTTQDSKCETAPKINATSPVRDINNANNAAARLGDLVKAVKDSNAVKNSGRINVDSQNQSARSSASAEPSSN